MHAAIGPYVCAIKTHCDIITDWSKATAEGLRALANEVETKTKGVVLSLFGAALLLGLV